MAEYPKMLYKLGGVEEIHGGKFSTRIVEDKEGQDAAMADGWQLTTTDAIAPPALKVKATAKAGG